MIFFFFSSIAQIVDELLYSFYLFIYFLIQAYRIQVLINWKSEKMISNKRMNYYNHRSIYTQRHNHLKTKGTVAPLVPHNY